jgi:hypothetical protein
MDLELAEQFQEVLLSGGIKSCSQSKRIEDLKGVDALTNSRSMRLSRNINLLFPLSTMRLRIPALARFDPCI